MAMIQFAINSQKDRRMTLKEIYTWIEDHFPYFREVAKPGWKVLRPEKQMCPFNDTVYNRAQYHFLKLELQWLID